MLPGGNPVIEVPGETPTFPVTTVGPVLVTADPASTPKLAAVPNDTFWANAGAAHTSTASAMESELWRKRVVRAAQEFMWISTV
jgi:hypothetical protein